MEQVERVTVPFCRSSGSRSVQIIVVSSNNGDLRAARSYGFFTAFVARSITLGPIGPVDIRPDRGFDLTATGLIDFARQPGV